jgi:two-component system sensor histidine kinase BaeS
VQGLTNGDYSVRNQVRGSDEIATLGRQVNRLAETLQANEGARRRWTADIAHELRTPITILQGELEAARDGIRPNNAATLDSLREEVLHLSRLVDDLQTLALADAGALNLKLAETDVVIVLQQVLDSLQERMQKAGLTLHSSLPEKLIVQADGQKLRQLMLNLLENSCRYTDSGGRIDVTLSACAPGFELSIEDSAPGLSADQCAQVLERFYRAESSRGRAGGGSGLGLAICREIVQAHGGDISVTPGTLGGLAIRIHLPDGV